MFMEVVERTLSYLNDAQAGIYQRGNILVRLIEEWAKGVRGERVKVCRLVGVTDKTLEMNVDSIIALQPSIFTSNTPLTGKVVRIEIYNPNPLMTFGGMGSQS